MSISDSFLYRLRCISTIIAACLALSNTSAGQNRLVVIANVSDAEIRVDGVLVGLTDSTYKFVDDAIEPGSREIVVWKEGYKPAVDTLAISSVIDTPWLVNLELEITYVRGLLEADLISYIVETGMPESEVFVERIYVGRTDELGTIRLDIPEGQRRIFVRHRNGSTREQTISVKPSSIIQSVKLRVSR